MRPFSLVAGGLCLAWLSASLAQTPSSTVSITQEGFAHPGGLGKIHVSVDFVDADGVLGASIPILFDTNSMTAISAFPIGELLATNAGAGPDFFNWTPRDQGMLVGYITELIPPTTILHAPGEVFTATFFVEPTQAGAAIPLVVEGIPGLSPPLGYDVILQLPDGSVVEAPTTSIGLDLNISNQFPFMRGDANANGARDLVDAVHTLEFMFLGTPPLCLSAIDADASGTVSLVDTLLILDHLFGTGTPIAEPYAECGGDQVGLPCANTTCP